MYFTFREIRDLIIAWFVIALAFSLLFYDITKFNFSAFVYSFLLSGLTVGSGFLLHELMHKFVAQRYGLQAHFYAFYGMLLLALLFSLIGFVFAAPGAVFIGGKRISKSQNGKISLVGPLTNVVLAFLFLILLFFGRGFVHDLGSYGLKINAFLGLFNMIPLMPFDGAKVWQWNKIWYWFVVVFSLILLIASYLV